VLDKIAGDIGLTPKYDITDFPVAFDLIEWEEFFRVRPWVGSVFYTNFKGPCVLIVNLFSFLKKYV
jgi:hypothetical protein